MRIPVVVEGPEPAVSVTEAKASKVFSDDDGDAYIQLLISIAQAQIDGSEGTLGRAIGVQTLKLEMPAGLPVDTSRLPLPNYIETVSNDLSSDGRSRSFVWKAGYEKVPAPIKHAIIMMAGVLRAAMPDEGGAVRRETVDGVGSQDYTVPNDASEAMQKVAANLLRPYKVLRV
jgi:hypothetical protein